MTYQTPYEQIMNAFGSIADTDSYKLSHHPQYQPGATRMMSYIESRGGAYDKALWFGIQAVIKESLMKPLTQRQVNNMITWAHAHLMENMARDLGVALDTVVSDYDGKLPILIKSAPEGSIIPVKNVLATIETTVDDPRLFSLVSYFETLLLRVWKPTTIATTALHIRETIMSFLNQTADDPEAEIAFKLHDFGSRGVSCPMDAMMSGMAPLTVFQGTDTTIGAMGAMYAYNAQMPGFSIPASEHSTTTSRGRDGEIALVQAMFDNFAKPGALFATVADSYDVINFLRNITPLFKDQLEESGATWIIRPDSCDPIKMPIQCVIELDKVFGHTVNSKGYKVLNNVRVIQGDGIGPAQVRVILEQLIALGYSASNMAFGMGGGLLQKCDRDTLKFSMKCCAIYVDGEWVDVYKDPSEYDENWNRRGGGSFKKSKKGRLELMFDNFYGTYQTVREEEVESLEAEGFERVLRPIYNEGELLIDEKFANIKRRARTA